MRKKRWLLAGGALLVAGFGTFVATRRPSPPPPIPGDYILITEVPLRATVRGAGGSSSVSGRVALHWHYTTALSANRKIELRSMNGVLRGLPPGWNGPSGASKAPETVGIILARPKEGAVLLDFDGRTISGEIPVLSHYRGIDGIYRRPKVPSGKESPDFQMSGRQKGRLMMSLTYNQPLEPVLRSLDQSASVRRVGAQLEVSSSFNDLKGELGSVRGFTFDTNDSPIALRTNFADARDDLSAFRLARSGGQPADVDIANSGPNEVMRKLCVQPMKVNHAAGDQGTAGRGLAFGKPEADDQWRKANIVFDWQPSKPVTPNSLRTIVIGDDDVDVLLGKAPENECVEIFFIEKFDDQEATGGAWTYGGLEDAQIVISDQLKDGKIDRTALAHELGHAMNLGHPGKAVDEQADSSAGTLMCPSGLLKDNPQKNSEDNAAALSNPWLTNSIEPKTGVADCKSGGTGSGNCGRCL